MFGYLDALFSDPIAVISMLLLALPGRLLAISAHEFAHAYVAHRCGDNTAKMMGRMTINPLKHLDIIGTLMMVLVGFGWAKPVPVNPRNFRSYRRDDLLVSLAGITMNLMLFLVGCVALYAIVGAAIAKFAAQTPLSSEYFVYNDWLVVKDSYIPITDMVRYAPYMSKWLVTPAFGVVAGYLTEMLMYFVITNLVLAVFNLIPIPPLDGYHVVNDLFIKRSLFANPRVVQISTIIMIILMARGYISDLIGYVEDFAFQNIGALAEMIYRAMGLF